MTRGRVPVRLLMCAAVSFMGAAAVTIAARQPAQAQPIDRCAALAGMRLDQVPAPATITSAAIGRDASLPSFCDVEAKVKPEIGVGIRLPLAGWNGKAVFVTRPGYCRPVEMADCNTALGKGYACAISDSGHRRANEQDDVWAHGNPQAQVDCGFRGTHVAAAAMKAVVQRFYGAPPRRNYLTGCSTGGRMALVEAQKFPYDFDGIVAGAPPLSKAGSSLSLMWNILSLRRDDGTALLGADEVRLLAAAAKQQCDARDGLADGIIGDPFSCRVDVTRLACRPGAGGQCLDAKQIAGVQRLYEGPRTPAGRPLGSGAPLPGSELGWIDAFLTRADGPGPVEQSMIALFSRLEDPARPASWRLEDFDWSRDYQRASLFGAYNDATDPDLSAFRDNGGKLIVYHGLADEFITPGSVVKWYEKVMLLNGAARAAAFARLFLAPGMAHCGGGEGPDRIDVIDAIDAWVDQARAPDRLIAFKAKPGTPAVFPIAADRIEVSRPIYPFPARARYDGRGDRRSPASFPATSPAVPGRQS